MFENESHSLVQFLLLIITHYLKWAETAQWYNAWLRAGLSVDRVPAEAGNFSLHHRVQNSSGAHLASYPKYIRGSFPGVKGAGLIRVGSCAHPASYPMGNGEL
jgi:hypothetical protein